MEKTGAAKDGWLHSCEIGGVGLEEREDGRIGGLEGRGKAAVGGRERRCDAGAVVNGNGRRWSLRGKSCASAVEGGKI